MHNAAFQELGIHAEYKAYQVKKEELKNFFQRLRSGEITGVNVTIPHKENVLPFVDDLTSAAKTIGAINTVYQKDAKLIGHNTDGLGYLQSLKEECAFDLDGKNIVVIGAGGAARAVVFALLASHVGSLVIVNRDESRAKKLMGELKSRLTKPLPRWEGSLEDLNDQILTNCDLLINTTSLGMQGGPKWEELDFVKNLPSHALVSDIVYRPQNTPLLETAKDLNLKIHYGYGMLLYQAVLAFECFVGGKAPTQVMREALLKALG